MESCAGREALLEEDLGEEAAAEELAPLTAQLAFAHSQLGRAQEAAEAYQVLRPSAPSGWLMLHAGPACRRAECICRCMVILRSTGAECLGPASRLRFFDMVFCVCVFCFFPQTFRCAAETGGSRRPGCRNRSGGAEQHRSGSVRSGTAEHCTAEGCGGCAQASGLPFGPQQCQRWAFWRLIGHMCSYQRASCPCSSASPQAYLRPYCWGAFAPCACTCQAPVHTLQGYAPVQD